MRKAVIEALTILVLAVVLGTVSNWIHPRSVVWSAQRPVQPAAQDSLFSVDLPALAVAPAVTTPAGQPKIIGRDALVRLLNSHKAQLIDARPLAEYQAGHLPHALALPLEELQRFEQILHNLPRDRWLITYCEGPPCDLSHQLAQVLTQNGYTAVAIYDGGANDWLAGSGVLELGGGHE